MLCSSDLLFNQGLGIVSISRLEECSKCGSFRRKRRWCLVWPHTTFHRRSSLRKALSGWSCQKAPWHFAARAEESRHTGFGLSQDHLWQWTLHLANSFETFAAFRGYRQPQTKTLLPPTPLIKMYHYVSLEHHVSRTSPSLEISRSVFTFCDHLGPTALSCSF